MFLHALTLIQNNRAYFTSLKEIAKKGAVVLFWTQNCYHCKSALKALNAYKQKNPYMPCYAIDVSPSIQKNSRDKYNKYCPHLSKISYIHDPFGKTFKQYIAGQSRSGFPFFVFFNGKGDITKKHLGTLKF